MDKNSEKIVELFKEISNKGWVKDVGRSWGGIGLTFEKEIGKMPDSKFEPDFGDIEIKCTSRYSRYPLYLFTIKFDGPNENEILRLAEKYGYYDHDFSNKKVLFRKVTKKINEENKYNFIFDIDNDNKKIFLCVFDKNGELIERESYINFSSIERHLNSKLKKIAYIKASTKKIDGEKFYRYYSIFLYIRKDFEIFLKLIQEGVLDISLISRISKSGPDRGRYRNKNVVFSIKKEDIPKLFECYYQYNHDISY